MPKKETNKYFYIISVIVALLVIGITISASFAFFTNSGSSTTGTATVITSGSLSLELVDGNVVGTTNGMVPGDSVTKTFIVRNTGTINTTYDVYFSEVLNTFADKSDLVYSLTSSDGGYNTISDQVIPSTSGNESKIINAYSINAGASHTYTLTIKFLNKNENQDDNKGKVFSGKLQINDYTSFKTATLKNNPFGARAIGSYLGSLDEVSTMDHIKRASSFDETIPKITISTDDSVSPVYVWYKNEDKTLYYYSEASIIYLPEDSSDLFRNYDEVKTIDLSGFDTSRVTDMSNMFSGMSSLLSLDLSNFDTSNVTNMKYMFFGTTSLTSLNISGINTSNVENMQGMFMNYPLANINLSHFDTSKVRDMSWMFSGVTNVEVLDLSSFSGSSLMYMSGMFSGMTNVNKIYVSNLWTNQNLAYTTTSVFSNCSNLVGGAGTAYDESKTNSDYAHIDEGESNPGYFTLKPGLISINENGYNYWNDNYSRFSYLPTSASAIAYPNYTKLVSESGPNVFIRTTYSNGSPTGHEACLYNNSKLFCIAPNYWASIVGSTDDSSESKNNVRSVFKDSMDSTLETTNTWGCDDWPGYIQCYSGEGLCYTFADGKVGCQVQNIICSVNSDGSANCADYS